ncbi:MAG: hypothetical protein HY580_01115 [Nitrospinae bacterium]|nr:hypothetical protein [Nitrospinota bacterium]
MFLEVEPNPNVEKSFSMAYRETSPPRAVFCIKYGAGEEELPVQVTGWDNRTQSPCPAYARRIEESGDGIALLIYGGSGGIRMKPLEDESPWDPASPGQWGETHLVYPVDCFVVYQDTLG